jgi:hypothetical protein
MSTRFLGHGVMTDRTLRVSAPLVSVFGWGVTEAGLVALPVVEHLYELEQVAVRGGSGLEPDRPADPGDLDLQAGLEGLHRGIVERVTG